MFLFSLDLKKRKQFLKMMTKGANKQKFEKENGMT